MLLSFTTGTHNTTHTFLTDSSQLALVNENLGEKMRLRTLLFSGLGWWMVVQEQAAAWTHVKPAPMPTSASSPSSYLGAPGGTVKVSKMSHRLHRRCFLPHASSGDGEGDNIAGGEKRLSTPAASSSNDNAALTFARIVIESNQATIEMVDGKLEKALGMWLD